MLHQVITSIVGVGMVGGGLYSWRAWKIDGALAAFFVFIGLDILLSVH